MRLDPTTDTVLHGMARGADSLAARAAYELGISVIGFRARWEKFGKAAGPIRNREMLDEKPDLVIAFHDDLESSKGTKDCVEEARRRGIPVEVISHERGGTT